MKNDNPDSKTASALIVIVLATLLSTANLPLLRADPGDARVRNEANAAAPTATDSAKMPSDLVSAIDTK